MALLIDKLRTGKFSVPFLPPDRGKEIKAEVSKLLHHSGLVVIEGSNVAEWLYAGTSQEFWNYRTDFPNLAPPWSQFWIECKKPSGVRSGSKLRDIQLPDRWGVRFSGSRQESGSWILRGTGFMEVDREAMGPLFILNAEIDQDGLWVNHSENSEIHEASMDTEEWGFCVPTPTSHYPEEEMIRDYLAAVNSLALAPLMTISFAHCRNVGQATVKPPEKLSRKHERRHGQPLIRHKVLQIGGQARAVDEEARASGVGRIEALHIVRGHFKHYTEDAPLMGKHVGTYWWADHARGDAAAGEVVKDYEVKP